jgi:hypothetical protein
VAFQKARISHMPTARRKTLFLLTCVLCFFLAFFVPSFTHRWAFDQAFSKFSRNPSPENAAVLSHEQRKNQFIHIVDSAVGGFVLACLLWTAGGLLRLTARSFQRIRGNDDSL